MTKRILMAALTLAIVVGCGQQTPTPDDSTPGPDAAQPAEKDGYTIAVVPKGLAHQFWLTVKAGAEAAAGLRLRRWLHLVRAPFLTATVIPVLLAGAWVWATRLESPFPGLSFTLALIGAVALQAAANTFNDYFDWASGTDQANNQAFAPFSGGSRAI